jgi:predicted flavoprotein YhiN
MKDFRLTLQGARPLEEAIVTAGGISVKEINPYTMESKIIHGLFFCGEVIDVDGVSGGYNLQAAFSTGRAAGEAGSRR